MGLKTNSEHPVTTLSSKETVPIRGGIHVYMGIKYTGCLDWDSLNNLPNEVGNGCRLLKTTWYFHLTSDIEGAMSIAIWQGYSLATVVTCFPQMLRLDFPWTATFLKSDIYIYHRT